MGHFLIKATQMTGKYKHEFAEKMINSNAHFGDKLSDYQQYLKRGITTQI